MCSVKLFFQRPDKTYDAGREVPLLEPAAALVEPVPAEVTPTEEVAPAVDEPAAVEPAALEAALEGVLAPVKQLESAR